MEDWERTGCCPFRNSFLAGEEERFLLAGVRVVQGRMCGVRRMEKGAVKGYFTYLGEAAGVAGSRS